MGSLLETTSILHTEICPRKKSFLETLRSRLSSCSTKERRSKQRKEAEKEDSKGHFLRGTDFGLNSACTVQINK